MRLLLPAFAGTCFAGVLAFGKRQNRRSEKLKFIRHSCKSVIPASLSFLQVCHSCKPVIPASLSFLQACHSCKPVIPASLSFLQVCHAYKSVIPTSLSFLQASLSFLRKQESHSNRNFQTGSVYLLY